MDEAIKAQEKEETRTTKFFLHIKKIQPETQFISFFNTTDPDSSYRKSGEVTAVLILGHFAILDAPFPVCLWTAGDFSERNS